MVGDDGNWLEMVVGGYVVGESRSCDTTEYGA